MISVRENERKSAGDSYGAQIFKNRPPMFCLTDEIDIFTHMNDESFIREAYT